MPYKANEADEQVVWTREYVNSMRRVRDRWGEAEYDRIYQVQKKKEPELTRFGFLNKYWLSRYDLDEKIQLPEKMASLIFVSEPPPPPNPVELTPEEIELGQQLFFDYGSEILIVLALYSLPFSYASARGVKVLAGTQYLSKDPNRRLIETTQFVVNVLSPGGLDRVPENAHDESHPVPQIANPPIGRGAGLKMAEMIRYLHCGIRPFIEERMPDYNVAEDGEPINQEDMAATLMTFAWIVPRGLKRLHIDIPVETLDAYVKIWSHIGYEMGVEPELLPKTYEEAGQLANLIIEDQIDPVAAQESEYTAVLINSLLDWFASEAPPGMKWAPAALMRHLFHSEHDWIVDSLGVPRRRFQIQMMRAGIWVEAKVFRHRVFRFGTKFAVAMMVAYRREGRPAFRVSPELAEKWGLEMSDELRHILDETPA